ncbi:amidohydrolase [Dongia sp.]|uniref:amidohydrolase family protein n=1 Tax=Dongia sp. TaxID=1977262 RepID=UPI0035ADCA0D
MQIDAHQHFWRVARGDCGWMESSDALEPLRRDFLPADFELLRRKHGIDCTVLVQAAPSVEETEYLLGLADATPWIGKVVGWIDFEDKAQRHHLGRWSKHRKFAGVRPMIQDIADPDWMHRADVQWAYQALIDLDLTFDALGFPHHIDNFRRLFDRYPALRAVIDHGLKPAIRDHAMEPWATGITTLARTTNAFCKLSGLANEAMGGWSVKTLTPYAAHLLESFGPARVMWGSDWPVVNLAGGYDLWRAVAEMIVPQAVAAQIFGGTAAAFYRL